MATRQTQKVCHYNYLSLLLCAVVGCRLMEGDSVWTKWLL